MVVLTTAEEHKKAMFECLTPSIESVVIYTFGMFAGIMADGRDLTKLPDPQWADNWVHAFLDKVAKRKLDTTITIGIADYYSCKGKAQCRHCEAKYNEQLERLLKTQAHWKNDKCIKWKITDKMHMKLYAFFDDKAELKRSIAGSRNFSNSGWDEISIMLDKKASQKLLAPILLIDERSRPLNGKNLATYSV